MNDSLRYAVGDHCLETAARELLRAWRPAHVLARFGGDEFVVLTPDLREADAPAMVARLQPAVSRAADAGS